MATRQHAGLQWARQRAAAVDVSAETAVGWEGTDGLESIPHIPGGKQRLEWSLCDEGDKLSTRHPLARDIFLHSALYAGD